MSLPVHLIRNKSDWKSHLAVLQLRAENFELRTNPDIPEFPFYVVDVVKLEGFKILVNFGFFTKKEAAKLLKSM